MVSTREMTAACDPLRRVWWSSFALETCKQTAEPSPLRSRSKANLSNMRFLIGALGTLVAALDDLAEVGARSCQMNSPLDPSGSLVFSE
jgi:hypothetical protein